MNNFYKILLLLSFLLLVLGSAKGQIITTFAGNGAGALTYTCCYSGDGGQATAAGLNNPVGLSFDAFGNLYIGDWINNRIRKVNTAGIITTVAGNGVQGYSGDGGRQQPPNYILQNT